MGSFFQILVRLRALELPAAEIDSGHLVAVLPVAVRARAAEHASAVLDVRRRLVLLRP